MALSVKVEMLYFHSKLPDPARPTRNILEMFFAFVWADKIKCTCFENNFCPSKSQKKVNLPKRLATCETSAIPCRRYGNSLEVANVYSSTIKPNTRLTRFKDL